MLPALLVCLASVTQAYAASAEVHYSPGENLEAIDVALLGEAQVSIDMAAFSLRDRAVIAALREAARCVRVRIVIEGYLYRSSPDLAGLAAYVRVRRRGAWLHLKGYAIDGKMLRSGSANFSASGLRRQDNDLVVLREPDLAQAFSARFEVFWTAGVALDDFEETRIGK